MKHYTQSKTVKFSALVAALGVLETQFHLLQDLLGEWYGLSYVLVAVATVYLRTLTSQPIGTTKQVNDNVG